MGASCAFADEGIAESAASALEELHVRPVETTLAPIGSKWRAFTLRDLFLKGTIIGSVFASALFGKAIELTIVRMQLFRDGRTAR